MHCKKYLAETAEIALHIDPVEIEAIATELHHVRKNNGTVVVIGIGGSLGNAIHMAADLTNLCGIKTRAPSNMVEITALINDYGHQQMFAHVLDDIQPPDALMVLSVGGGTELVSKAITESVRECVKRGVVVLGVVGPHGGETAKKGTAVLKIPAPTGRITPHTEAFQAVVWHCLVSHPLLQTKDTVW